jgi:uncharacterized protein YjiS (DUF1127 family)
VQPLSSSVCAKGAVLPAETNWGRRMDTISSAAAQLSASSGLRGFIRWIGICADRLDAYLARRDGIKALREMDDRQLRDIGLTRCDIEGAFYDDAKHIRRHWG